MEAARTLKGSARRVFMARTVKELGYGGQRYVEREFGWDRGVIRKGMGELAHGTPIADIFPTADENLRRSIFRSYLKIFVQSLTHAAMRTPTSGVIACIPVSLRQKCAGNCSSGTDTPTMRYQPPKQSARK